MIAIGSQTCIMSDKHIALCMSELC